MRQPCFSLRALAPIALFVACGAASAVGLKAGDWDLSVGGFVNTYYTYAHCNGNQAITGLALATKGLGCNGRNNSTVIGNGLLPNALIVSAKTNQAGYDIGATVMIAHAVATGSALAANSQVDVRQSFMTVGRKDAGTLKLGRDYGMFGFNATVSDMTLIGVGLPTAATQRGRVSLGHIGAGYTYLGNYGQIIYTTPSLGGFTLSGGAFSPVDSGPLNNTFAQDSAPQFQAQAAFAFEGGKIWVDGKTQRFDSAVAGVNGFRMSGGEVGASYSFGPVDVLGNFQFGKGLGILSDGDSGSKKQRNLLAQGTYKLTPAFKLGASWGQSKFNSGAGAELETNDNVTVGGYYKVTKDLTAIAELSRSTSDPFAGGNAKQKGLSIGAFLFF